MLQFWRRNCLLIDYSKLAGVPAQTCVLGNNKPLEDRLEKVVISWSRAQHASLTPRERIRTPKRADILERLDKIWRQVPNEIVKNSLLGSGYVYQSDIDCSDATSSVKD